MFLIYLFLCSFVISDFGVVLRKHEFHFLICGSHSGQSEVSKEEVHAGIIAVKTLRAGPLSQKLWWKQTMCHPQKT
jgi:hypothetical protein